MHTHVLCFHADFEWTANYQMQFIQNANIGFMKIRSDPCTHCYQIDPHIIKHQRSNLLIQHDFAHKHVLKTSQCFGTINGIISFKSFVEIGIGSLKIPLICSMENTYKKSLLSVRETLYKFLEIINFKIISETYFLTFFS